MATLARRTKAEIFEWEPGEEQDIYSQLRHAAASKLCLYHEHLAGGGSYYITIGDSLKLRFANHENTSSMHAAPDYNFVNTRPSKAVLDEIVARIQYPRLCKKLAFAKHVGLSVQKLKKVLPPDNYPDCYEDVCEDEYYPNTFTQFVVVAKALAALEKLNITDRFPVRQELQSVEDYNGREY